MQPDRPLDYYIKRLMDSLNMGQFASQVEVERAYRYLAGDLIYKLTTSFSYRDGTLRLQFAAAALRQEMAHRRENLRLKLNEQLGGEVVKRIVI